MKVHRPHTVGLRRWVLLGLVAVLVGLTGCAGTPAPTPAPVTPTAVPPRTATPAAPATPAPSADARALTLTWWTPEFLSPKAPQPAGPLLAEQLAAFQAHQEGDVSVNIVLKARYGKGGLLDFLRTAQPVAPGTLPDLVTLDVIELEQAAAIGLLQPLDGLLDPELLAGLYPFASANGRFNGRLLAVQYIADIDHAVYAQDQLATPPTTWPEIISARLPYLFSVAGAPAGPAARPQETLTHAIISQYISGGAVLDAASRGLRVEAQPLARLLAFYAESAQSGLLPPAALEVGDADTVWSVYRQSTVPLACVSARRYLAERGSLQNVRAAAAPGWAAPAWPVADGWALAVITTDPARQRLAAELIAWLLTPANAAAWAQAAVWLPTSPEALKTWGTDSYYTFLDGQLANALSHPVGADYAQAAARIQKAVISVIKGETTPEQAVEAALAP